MPVIGYLNSTTPEGFSGYLPALRQGLKESGYVESENVAIEYRWAENQPERLDELAADLVRRQVKVIVAWGPPASMAAGRATATIPIVFAVPEDPIRLGLVASLARPGGNATGVNLFTAELAAKRLELLSDFLPSVNRVAVLLNPAEPTIAAANLRDVERPYANGNPRERRSRAGLSRSISATSRPQSCAVAWRRSRCASSLSSFPSPATRQAM
jgi:putative tryptophan/tyrosine transport system substrate-binding protein